MRRGVSKPTQQCRIPVVLAESMDESIVEILAEAADQILCCLWKPAIRFVTLESRRRTGVPVLSRSMGATSAIGGTEMQELQRGLKHPLRFL